MKIVTLEEHFTTPKYVDAVKDFALGGHQTANEYMKAIARKQADLDVERIADMDEAGIDMQVLSLSSIMADRLDASTATAIARDANDIVSAAVRAHPDRFAAFAALGIKEPGNAAQELRRCVTELGMCGAMLNGTSDGKFLDAPEFLPVFEAAQELDVPIYLHPAPPPDAVREAYYSGLPDNLGDMLSIAGWGWHVETGLHVLRMIVSGLFEKLPRLQVIIGHMGENLPFSIARASTVLSRAGGLPRPVIDTFRNHFHITTSGYFTLPPFLCALTTVGADNILISVDYPFSTNTSGRAFLDGLPVSSADLEKIAHGNAEKLLKL